MRINVRALVGVSLMCVLLLKALPAEAAPVQVLTKGGGYNAPQPMDVALCGSLTGPCGETRHFNQGEFLNCGTYMFKLPAGLTEASNFICVSDPPGSAPPVVPPAAEVILPPPPLSQKPAPLNPNNTRPYTAVTCKLCLDPGFAIVWYYRDASDKWQAVSVSGWAHELTDGALDIASSLMQRDAGDKFDAVWTNAKVAQTQDDPVLQALVAKLIADTRPAAPIVVTPPAPVCKITAQSATVQDRAVYKTVSATGTASSSISGVRSPAGTAVPCSSKIGNYFSVAGTKDTMGRVIAAGYAVGAVQ